MRKMVLFLLSLFTWLGLAAIVGLVVGNHGNSPRVAAMLVAAIIGLTPLGVLVSFSVLLGLADPRHFPLTPRRWMQLSVAAVRELATGVLASRRGDSL